MAAAIGAASCNGLSQPPVSPSSFDTLVMVGTGAETGPPSKILSVPGSPSAVVVLFPDGNAFYSPDGFNLGGGGSTIQAYVGSSHVVDVEAVSGGVDALLANGSVYFSPDGKNLGGGGSSVAAYDGPGQILSINPVGAGIDAVFASGGPVYYSPDGLALGGGGHSIQVYAGGTSVQQVVAVGPGDAVVTLLEDGTAYYSPNNRDLAGGNNTIAAAPHSLAIKLLVKVGSGLLAEFAEGSVYLSPDGRNLAGGGATVAVAPWDASVPNGPFDGRDSAHFTEFLGRLWLSGGFDDPEGANSCFATCSFFDLWSSKDLTGTSWNSTASFATATSPDPRDSTPVVNNGTPDVPPPTDFYDSYSPIVVWNGRLFAIGSTVWSSPNGTNWARLNLADGTAAPGPITVRATENSRALSLGAKLFFLQPDSGEVYSTTDPDALAWTDLGPIPGFTPRCGATAFVLQGKLWIEGGGNCDYSKVYNDIWSSADGITWVQNEAPAQWSARMWACIASGGSGIIWLTAGYAPTDWNNTTGTLIVRYGGNHSDVWYTKDGTTWKQFKADYGSGLVDGDTLEPRHAASCYIGTGSAANTQSLIVIAGSAGSVPNAANERVSNSIRTLELPAAASLP